jgi:hypothetical protein
MRIQLDTVRKTIKIEEEVLMGEFMDKIKILFPNKTWREFKLISGVITEWINPIIYPIYPVYPTIPIYPDIPIWYQQPWIICTTSETIYQGGNVSSGITVDYKPGVYNIDLHENA